MILEQYQGGTMEIPLTQGYVALVDAADYYWLSKDKWYAKKYKNGDVRAYRREPVIRDGKKKEKRFYMSREIMGLKREDKCKVDHENHKTLDNHRSNLRICTHQENQFNRKKHFNNKSGFKGVYFNKKASLKNPWHAQIQINRKVYYLGLHATKELAHEARNKIAYSKDFHGKYAYSG